MYGYKIYKIVSYIISYFEFGLYIIFKKKIDSNYSLDQKVYH